MAPCGALTGAARAAAVTARQRDSPLRGPRVMQTEKTRAVPGRLSACLAAPHPVQADEHADLRYPAAEHWLQIGRWHAYSSDFRVGRAGLGWAGLDGAGRPARAARGDG